MASSGWNVVCATAMLFAVMACFIPTVSADVDKSAIAAALAGMKAPSAFQGIPTAGVNQTSGRRLMASECYTFAMIYSSHSTKYCLAGTGAKTVVQQRCNPNSDAQIWAVLNIPYNGLNFAVFLNGKYVTCMEVKGGSKGSGAAVMLYKCRSVAQAYFQQIRTPSGAYKGWYTYKPLHVYGTSLVLQISGSKLVQRPATKKANTYFKLRSLGKYDGNGNRC